jgi:hypothetical protein
MNMFCFLIVAGKLAPTLVYDDGCHLVKYVINHIGKDLSKTSAMEILASTPISVDRSHFRNHVGIFCRKTTNPDKNPCQCSDFCILKNSIISFSIKQYEHSSG